MSARHGLASALRGAEAAAALTLASLAMRLLPRRARPRLLGRAGPAAAEVAAAASEPRARRVGRRVERVAALLPWRPKCLPQAIATRVLLRRRGIACESHVGVVSTAPLRTHAWVTVRGRTVQGGGVKVAGELARFR